MVIAFLSAPTIEPFIQVVGSPVVWAMLGERLLPDGSWFWIYRGHAAGGERCRCTLKVAAARVLIAK